MKGVALCILKRVSMRCAVILSMANMDEADADYLKFWNLG